ncbi:hypothetical protein BBK82_38325 [Lentzea guizhouensis]|uniref:Secreted protein n=1 Tax=Lentzea guizhouensis TaxID=1586287 RepID=A0A1B2HTG3_9PSEU|nr:hypothetical protein [Lentzea guizhouensis]ANZ40975.1 hypothetical protein BBK82_38325 [Lentzea guizhouensis]
MKLRQTLAAVGTTAAAIALSLTMASPAHAADEWMYTDDGDPGGKVEFTANGDVVKLCDIEEDGHSVYLRVRDSNSNAVQYTYTIGGEGRCQTFRASLGEPYDLTEGRAYDFRICLSKNGSHSYCDDATWKNQN